MSSAPPALRYLFERWLKRQPWLYLGIVARGRRAYDGTRKDLHAGTELVIDAFPRSGNSFAVQAFRQAQGRPVAIAHHLHAPALVLAACRRSLPTLTLLRDPLDAVASYAVARGDERYEPILREYVDYYRALGGCRGGFVLARFETVTQDFGVVVEALNRRFRRSFLPFEPTPENLAAVRREIELAARGSGQSAGRSSLSSRVALPSEARRELLEGVRRVLLEQHGEALARARSCYAEWKVQIDV